ncbi:hypothetical protein BCV69DRAFT_281910 [Microstroma glucosiphilum]|uniref:L-type lectin-like domain-containing protein n=1 Tax=Pseudomicrostroma glucosiphilum TaxID=1684307 RepID=A0A316UFU2_9BASI|nr:hypothetical protein BCV69DRAFT_281910 [Pseudomicrostroma glucosiphilum]PWN22005.1 hypothetical protein BCV69DRAFT_281910 [Pseudomicrostroma glucosiphilum]
MVALPSSSSSARRAPGRYSSSLLAQIVLTFALFSALLVTTSLAARTKATVVEGSEAILPMKKHSLYAPYVESNLQNKYWDFGGDAIVDTNRHVRLTQDKPHQAGYLWSRTPINNDNYEIEFEFRIDGKAGVTFGDGLALWLTDDRAKTGPVFGSKDRFRGLGVFFDTYANARHPYAFPRVMAMIGDGKTEYNGARDGGGQELGACSIDIRRTRVATKGRLTFVRGVYLELKIHYKEWDTWEPCFKIEDAQVPRNPFLGFSSLTGDVSDAHDIVNVKTSQIVFKNRSHVELLAERRKHFSPEAIKSAKAGSDYTTAYRASSFVHGVYHLIVFLVKWGIVVAVLAALVILGLRYRKKRDVKRF